MSRRILWGAGLAAGAVFLLLVAGVLLPVPVPAEARQYFDASFLARAEAYNLPRNLIYLISTGASAGILVLAIARGWDEALGAWASRVTGARPALAAGLVWAALSLITLTVELPVSVARRMLDRSYGLSTSSWALWVADFAKSTLIGLAIGGLLWIGFFRLIRRRPQGWWPPATVGFTLFIIVSSALGPVLLDPLFNRFTPLHDPALRREVVALAAQADLPVQEVLVMDASKRTTRVNAYFAGFGSTRRVVLYDTLLQKYDRRQVLSVVAHELAHWHFNHIYLGLTLAAVGSAITFWLAQRMLTSTGRPGRPGQVAALMLFFSLVSFAVMPLENAISRVFERQADRFAIILTRDPQASAALDLQLAVDNLSDVSPHPFTVFVLYSHPPVLERVEAASGKAP